jgi:predicted DNA-binding transcriptional regulator YafY
LNFQLCRTFTQGMSVTKYQLIRYKILDQCFRNPGRSYFIEDLIDACNDAIIRIDPTSKGISRRTLFMDIEFMESEAGWSVPLERYTLGRRCYYRYSDLSFSISNQPLNLIEAEQLKSALLVMSRFSGVPQFEWVDELIPQLESQFDLKRRDYSIMSFESNQYLKGKEFLSKLFTAINNKQVISITYKDFKHNEAYSFNFHPYYLKQYNSRWFVFGRHNEIEKPDWNVALDRILKIEESLLKFIDCEIIWEDYFDDFIGVSKPEGADLEKIELIFSPSIAPYIITKPIHSSQIVKQLEEGLLVKIKVIPNFELEQLILSFGEGVKVLSPIHVQKKIVSRIQNSLSQYNEIDT